MKKKTPDQITPVKVHRKVYNFILQEREEKVK
jgi:hypothetical protein